MEPVAPSSSSQPLDPVSGSPRSSPRASISSDPSRQPIAPEGLQRAEVGTLNGSARQRDLRGSAGQRELRARIQKIFLTEIRELVASEGARATSAEMNRGRLIMAPGLLAGAYGITAPSTSWALAAGVAVGVGLTFPSIACQSRVIAGGIDAIQQEMEWLRDRLPGGPADKAAFVSQFLCCASQSEEFRASFSVVAIDTPHWGAGPQQFAQTGGDEWAGILEAARRAPPPQGSSQASADRPLLIEALSIARGSPSNREAGDTGGQNPADHV